MNKDEVFRQLTPIFHDVFDDDDIELHAEMSAADIDEWDSLSHIRLFVAVEKSMDIRFSSSEIAGLENVGQFADLIKKKIEG